MTTTTITTLHDAARRLEALADEMERILTEARPLEDASYQAVAAATAVVGRHLDPTGEWERIEQETGWSAMWRAADRIRDLAGTVDEHRLDAHHDLFVSLGVAQPSN